MDINSLREALVRRREHGAWRLDLILWLLALSASFVVLFAYSLDLLTWANLPEIAIACVMFLFPFAVLFLFVRTIKAALK